MELREDIKRVKRANKSFIFSIKEGDLFELNEVGSFIIDKIQEGIVESQIIEALCNETGEKKETVASDVLLFIGQLKQRNFLK